MSQPNGDMFSKDFFPTPRNVARKMVSKIDREAKYWIEPSAGKGDICDVIMNPCTYQEFEEENPEVMDKINSPEGQRRGCRPSRFYDEDTYKRRNIDVIESHPGLVAVLRSKGFPVVGYDWLDYSGVSYYCACVMNPPFSEGAKHLLKAWDFMHSGEIVCLLNQETIDNPYTEERKRLLRIIEAAGGEVERLGSCFDTAERKTNVEVAMVYLKKVAPDDSADLWAKEAGHEKVYNVEVGDDPNMLAIRDNLGNMEHWYNMANEHWVKGIEHIRRARLYMNQNKINDYRSGSNHDADFKHIAGMAIDNAQTSRTEFLRRHRLLAWTSVFTQMDFNRWLDSKQQEKFLRDIERDATIPFTADNIKGTLENVFLSRKKLFDESVANVFDELTSHAVENCSGPEMPASLKSSWRKGEGWKTNDSYKVNERLIFPCGCRWDKDFGHFRTSWGDADRIYTDLDRILCVLEGRTLDGCHTVGGALQRAFDRSKNWKTASTADQATESQYFEIRFFKKGTVHLKWKRLDLLEAFNKHAAQGKKWLGECSQQYRPSTKKEKEYYCQVNGCHFVDNACDRCGSLQVDPLDQIRCELCRAITEATGDTYCPLHPKHQPVFEGREEVAPLQIAAHEEPTVEEILDWHQPDLFAELC